MMEVAHLRSSQGSSTQHVPAPLSQTIQPMSQAHMKSYERFILLPYLSYHTPSSSHIFPQMGLKAANSPVLAWDHPLLSFPSGSQCYFCQVAFSFTLQPQNRVTGKQKTIPLADLSVENYTSAFESWQQGRSSTVCPPSIVSDNTPLKQQSLQFSPNITSLAGSTKHRNSNWLTSWLIFFMCLLHTVPKSGAEGCPLMLALVTSIVAGRF